MSIAPIGIPGGFGVTPGFGLNPAYGVAAGTPTTQVDNTAGAQGVQSFGTLLADKLSDLNGVQQRSDQLAVKAATGDLQDIHEYTIAANEAAVATQLVVTVRNKA
ncbi:MAG: flagellar hook-basal body complex protein FliE, partial [Micrococcales bacterium]|nr:flagellar hook-basal body complex protein FliE [Micrococcales bacterium]